MAAINFPSNPNNGDTFSGYVYDSTYDVWNREPLTLDSISDVNATGAADGQTLIYDDLSGIWSPGDAASSLGDLTDVDTYDAADGQTLVYNAASDMWEPGAAGGSFEISETAPTAPEEGDIWYNSTTGKTYIYYTDVDSSQWVEIASTTMGYLDLDQLNDVNAPTPANGESLVYDSASGQWVNADATVEVYGVDTTATDYFMIPVGTDAERPVTPANGYIRFNTTSGEPEYYSEAESAWFLFRQVASSNIEVDYLVVAGGGGGGTNGGGGGGAGGLLSNVGTTSLSIPRSSYSITVGSGGTPDSAGTSSTFYTVTAVGGGQGESNDVGKAGSGGSGGGGSFILSPADGVGGTGISGQGNNGGSTSWANGGNHASAGGGGAGFVGETPPGQNGPSGDGGDGLQINIDGNAYYWAGGGGAGSHDDGGGAVAGSGGLGGGGGGAVRSGTQGVGGGSALNSGATPAGGTGSAGGQGGINTGGGGGGGSQLTAAGGQGGSGIVVIRYPLGVSLSADPGLVYTNNIVTFAEGDRNVAKFTAGTGSVAFS